MAKKRDDMATTTVHQVAVGNTGQRATSSSSSPPSASVRNQVSATSIGAPGQAGVPTTQNVNQNYGLMAPGATPGTPPGPPSQATTRPPLTSPVGAQATPGGTPISLAGGQSGQGTSLTSPNMPNMPLIQSYVQQFRSGALNPNEFATRLREVLQGVRAGAAGAVGGAAQAAESDALARARAGLNQARGQVSGAVQKANSAGASLPSDFGQGPINAAEQWIIDRESSGQPTAENPSGAFGLGQLMPANRQKYAAQLGISNPDTTDPGEQLAMMRAYIQERYGSPEAAVEFWKANGWY